MDDDKELTGYDYLHIPFLELQSREDFSLIAFQFMSRICNMSSGELENLAIKLIEGDSNG